MSFFINESLQKFLKRIVGAKKFKNSSDAMRSALILLQQEKDIDMVNAVQMIESNTDTLLPRLTSSILITIPRYSEKLELKLNKLEVDHQNSILHKSTFSHQDISTITYFLEDTMDEIQSFITDVNSLEELKNFRYAIHQPEE